MKKLLLILMLCPMLLLPACTGNSGSGTGSDRNMQLLDQDIAISNAQMPLQVDFCSTVMSLSREGKVVVYKYKIDEDAIDFDSFIEGSDEFKSKMRNKLIAFSKENGFIKLVVDAGCELHYVYEGNQTHKMMTIIFTLDELKTML